MESTEQTRTATVWKEGSNVFGPSGSNQELVAFLPSEARTIPVARFDLLQTSYNGRLEIEHKSGRVLIGRKFLAYSHEQVRTETERFRTALATSLGLSTALA